MKSKIYLIIVFVMMTIIAYSQTVTLKVTGTGKVLIGAHVYANEKSATAKILMVAI